MLDRVLTSPVKVAVIVFLAALGFYLIAGWDIGADALDSDTLSLVLQWKLVRSGVVLDDWILSTPKFLPVVVDGALYELGRDGAVLARSLLTSALLIALAAAFVHLVAGWQASLAAAGLLLLNRTTFTAAFGGNSTALYTTFLIASALCFVKWPSRRPVVAGLLLLFGASLTRIEGLSYVGLAAVALFAASWKHDRKFSFLSAIVAAGLIATVFLADLWVPTTLSGRLRSGRSVALELNERAKEIAEVRQGEEMYAAAVTRIEQGYPETALYLLGHVMRPLFLFVPMALAGLILLRARAPLPVLIVSLLGAAPLVYCAVLHFLGVALFERFYLPTAVAMIIATSFAFHEALTRLARLNSRKPAWAGLAIVALLLAGTLGIGGRDVYYHKSGYLLWRVANLREYAEGLVQLKDTDLSDKQILVYGWHHAYTNLVLHTYVPNVSHDGDALVHGAPGDRLSQFDYLLYGEGDADVDSLFAGMVCGAESCWLESGTARFETFWVSPSGEFKFFRKTI
ncbi:MAG: hypothetical protein O2968_16640 [Acidobacteria bacterium]|nr:hypothetical protein [Acidobacteriota bacterium]